MAETDILFSRKSICYSIFSYRIFLVRFQLNEIHELRACQVECCHWSYRLVVLFHSDIDIFRNYSEFDVGKKDSCRWCEWSHSCSQGFRSSEASLCEDSRWFYNRSYKSYNASNNIHRFCFNSCIWNACLWPVHHRSRLNCVPFVKILVNLFRTLTFRRLDCILQESTTNSWHRLPRNEYNEVWNHVLCNYLGDPCRCIFLFCNLVIFWYFTADSAFDRLRWELLHSLYWSLHKLCSLYDCGFQFFDFIQLFFGRSLYRRHFGSIYHYYDFFICNSWDADFDFLVPFVLDSLCHSVSDAIADNLLVHKRFQCPILDWSIFIFVFVWIYPSGIHVYWLL